jgi:TPR repeat protein
MRHWLGGALAAAVLGLAMLSPCLAGEARMALVIGNAAYPGQPLDNPVNDARGMAAALRGLGFDVMEVEDGTLQQMQRAIVDFGGKLKQKGAVGLFYYAGHGIQMKGLNYLIPVDAHLAEEADVRIEAVPVDLVTEQMGDAGDHVHMIVLDACRNNPFEQKRRGGGKGLAAMDAAAGTLIAYATAPGSVAADGTGGNGLYTQELLAAMKQPGLKVEEVFKHVRAAVMARSGGAQTPWESSSLTGDFVFNATAPPAPAAAADERGVEIAFWESIKDSMSPADFAAYLKRYPNGAFAALARNRLAAPQPEQQAMAATRMPNPERDAAGDELRLGDTAYAAKNYAEALRHYRKAAERGDAAAAYSIGRLYHRGQGVARDDAEALRWSRKAAEQGNADGENAVGFLLFSGRGIARDYGEALRWLRQSLDHGNMRAAANIGLVYQDGLGVPRDLAEALRWFRKAADAGDAFGQRHLGHLYQYGLGVPQDYAEAMRWYRKAELQGDALAENNIGVLYERGHGVQQDYAEAMRWFRKAAEQDSAPAQVNLGLLYFNGHGVEQDYAEAMRWYRRAADQGDAAAQRFIGFLYASGDGVAQDYGEAMRWYRKAAAEGDAPAQFKIGLLYEHGHGVPKDPRQARAWIERAAAAGHAEAERWLAAHPAAGAR